LTNDLRLDQASMQPEIYLKRLTDWTPSCLIAAATSGLSGSSSGVFPILFW